MGVRMQAQGGDGSILYHASHLCCCESPDSFPCAQGPATQAEAGSRWLPPEVWEQPACRCFCPAVSSSPQEILASGQLHGHRCLALSKSSSRSHAHRPVSEPTASSLTSFLPFHPRALAARGQRAQRTGGTRWASRSGPREIRGCWWSSVQGKGLGRTVLGKDRHPRHASENRALGLECWSPLNSPKFSDRQDSAKRWMQDPVFKTLSRRIPARGSARWAEWKGVRWPG